MNREQLIADLKEALEIAKEDQEIGHQMADEALIKAISDPVVTRIWNSIPKWYA